MKTLNQMSEMTKDFFEEHHFDLNQRIDEIKKSYRCNVFHVTPSGKPRVIKSRREIHTTPLETAIEENKLEVIKELLDQGLDINEPLDDFFTPLMYCIAQQKTEAFEELLNHPQAQNIDFDYYIEGDTGDWQDLYEKEYIHFYLIRKTFSDEPSSEDHDDYEKHKKMLERIMDIDSINFTGNLYKKNALCILANYFNIINEYYNGIRTQYHLKLVQIFLEKGIDVNLNFRTHDEYQKMIKANNDNMDHNNNKNELPKAPISELFDFTGTEVSIDVGRATQVSLDQEENLIKILKELFRYAHVHLNVYATYDYRHGTPFMIAVSHKLNNVIDLLCEEIQNHCFEQILEYQKQGYDQESQKTSLQNKLQNFIEEHSFLNENIKNNDFEDEGVNMADSPQEIHNKTLKLLHEKVVPFVFSMLKPKKCLDEIIYSEKMKKELTEAGFNLKEGFKQKAKGKTLLDFAAITGNKALILGLAIQSSFESDFSPQDILKSVNETIKNNKYACCEILLSFLNPNYKLFQNLLENAISQQKPGFVRLLVNQYHSLGGSKLKFNLLDEKSSYYKSLLSRSLKLYQCPYLLNDLKRMMIENGPIHIPNHGLQENHLLMSNRLKQYALQFIERHHSQQIEIIEDRIIDPIIKYYEHLRKLIIDYGLYEPFRMKTMNRVRTKVQVSTLSTVNICHILSYLGTEFDEQFPYNNHNLRYAAARDVFTRYFDTFKNRKDSQNSSNKEAVENSSNKGLDESESAKKKRRIEPQSTKINIPDNIKRSNSTSTSETNLFFSNNTSNNSKSNMELSQNFNQFLNNASEELDNVQKKLNSN